MRICRRRLRCYVHPAAVILAGVLLLPSGVRAQRDVPELSSLKPTGSPAFVLFGLAPSEIERPGSPADFGLMLASLARDLADVPQDFAAELAPYWIGSHEKLTWAEDVDRNVIQSVLRTLAVSTATAAIGTDDAPVSGLSFGTRVQVLSGTLSQESQDTLRALEASLAAESALLQRLMSPRLAALDAVLAARLQEAAALGTPEMRQASTAAAIAMHESAKRELVADVTASSAFQDSIAEGRKRFENIVLERTGPTLEISAAGGWAFPNATWERGTFDRLGVWATLAWPASTANSDGPRLTPLVLVRYLAQVSDTMPDYLDIGGRLILSDDRYGISAEVVLRDPRGAVTGDDDRLYRVAGVLEYQMQSNAWAIVAFGRDHDSTRQGSLIARLGLRFQFAGQRYDEP